MIAAKAHSGFTEIGSASPEASPEIRTDEYDGRCSDGHLEVSRRCKGIFQDI